MGEQKYFDWDAEKSNRLKAERELGFEDILIAIHEGRLFDIVEHHNPQRYPNQKIFVVLVNGYVYLVPFVEDSAKIFLKTIIPSRKATQQYLAALRRKQRP